MSNYPYSPDPHVPAGRTVQEENAGSVYRESEHEQYRDPAGNQVEQHVEAVDNEDERRVRSRYWFTTVVYFLLGVLEVILLLRFIFRLLGANQGNAFVSFLYDLSSVFVAPFNGIFNDQTIGQASVFELSTLIAMLIYALIAWGIASLLRVLLAPGLSGHYHSRMTRRIRV